MQSPAGTVVFIISIGKGSYGGFWLCKLGFIEKNCSSFPLVGKIFVGKICIARPLHKPAYVKRKRPTRPEDA